MRVVSAFFLALIASIAFGQPAPRRVQTLDVWAIQARRIVVGKITQVTPRKDSGGNPMAPYVTIAATETLKGEALPALTMIGYRSDTEFKRMQTAGHRMLAFQSLDEPRGSTFIDLDADRLVEVTADEEILTKADEVLGAVRKAIRRFAGKAPKVAAVAPFHDTWERNYDGMTHDDFPIQSVEVPADERLEERTLTEIAVGASDVRARAIRTLRYFQTNANAALLRGFLEDAYAVRWAEAKYNWGVEVRKYPIREAALETLESWGQAPPKRPALQREIDESAAIEELIVVDPQSIVPEAKLPMLTRFPRLKRLQVMIYRVTDAHLAQLAKAKTVEDLDVGDWSEITDAGLPILESMPRLRRLNLASSKITDAGLPTLARIKSLRWLDVIATRVTPEGIAAFRRLRPDVETVLTSD